ncbi:MAG: glycosyltransferase family 4 protein [Nanoarchaeota archaeon]|nr:glycosyltransferase family 4 protein [Nanoarchaeota archaeon]
MRILMLNYEFPPIGGGAGNANFNLLREYSHHKGIEVDLITSSWNKFDIDRFSDFITIHKLDIKKKDIHYWRASENISYALSSFYYANTLLSKKKYDLIHCFFTIPPGIIPYFYNMFHKRKIPYIISLRGSDVPGFNERLKHIYWLQKPLIRDIWKHARHVVANSEGLKRLALNTNPNQEISVIYNGVDTEEFVPRKKRSKEFTLLTVSRLIPRKRIDEIIRAMPGLKTKSKLVIAGEGPEEPRLRALAAEQNVKVEFNGFVRHELLPEMYQDADVFVLPSINEGMSNTVLEAMASGLPIITTDTGGTKELIKGNGIILKDPSGIGDAVNSMTESKQEQYGKKSRELALNLSWKKVAEAYLKLYRR